ncbi:threonine-phosphate decarboxylase [Aestuariicella hydrocarbonica]|uniref:threonine-phosphate decarboxylase n=1 Tax=Pseudomaricurvus hydrocarbonicus TaxID=1470433 RepID=A0A9E5JRK8_9GAMM|nr:threonine-phosphate decarboxylase CobD [Aestuariicella hydrocarbonica]NHO64258.1 threonine-phosphate decarboxylase [Aestuariicella hydrocarbonica]
MLNHGGQLEKIKAQYPQVTADWLDLSTGIAPWSWPVTDIPAQVWQRLPEAPEGLCQAAANYYGCEARQVVPVGGSQVAIELLPECMPQHAIAIPRWGYGEHARCWSRSGHDVVFYDSPDEVTALLEGDRVTSVLVINPNNPSAAITPLSCLLSWLQMVTARGGILLVDEAFADVEPGHHSAVLLGESDHLVVLRSVGKFFGMAGLRLGFLIAGESLRQTFLQKTMLWSVSGPAQWMGERMLSDSIWQRTQRHRVSYYKEQLVGILNAHLLQDRDIQMGVGPLFVSLFARGSLLPRLFHFFAQRGILVRIFEPQDGVTCLRIGLTDEQGLARLLMALDEWAQQGRRESDTVRHEESNNLQTLTRHSITAGQG